MDEEDLDGNVVAKAATAVAPAAHDTLEGEELAAKARATRAALLTPAKKAELEKRFKAIDADGNGLLSKEEIGDLLLLDEGDATLEEVWKVADADGDGKVSFDEFVLAAEVIEKAEAADVPGLDSLGI